MPDFVADLDSLWVVVPGVLLIAVIAATLDWSLFGRRKSSLGDEARRWRLLLALGIVTVGIGSLVIFLQKGLAPEFLKFLGLILTAIIGMSSTTFVSNAMAGLMMRTVKSYRPGDFVHVGDEFGRVTEIGLFHTEIQTEDRDLTTIPNLYILSRPIRVIRRSGTVISATMSLGYDIPTGKVETEAQKAALSVGLKDAFVQITNLGDHAVHYRVGGLLSDVSTLITTRSRLRRAIIDHLHAAEIEIVSPRFMNQRPIDPHTPVMPSEEDLARTRKRRVEVPVEKKVFDKADTAAELVRLKEERDQKVAQLKELESALSAAKGDEKKSIEAKIEGKKRWIASAEKSLTDWSGRLDAE